MLTRRARAQLIIFAILGGSALVFATLVYGDAPRSTGVTHTSVTIEFDDVSGLYPRALVSYRGVKVGQVDSLDFRDDGVSVKVYLEKGADVPTDVQAQIKSTSAIGEQFIDLLPQSAEGPYLAGGDTIPASQTSGLLQITPVLESADALVESVPLEQTANLLDQLEVAIGGSGQDFSQIVDDSNEILDAAQQRVLATTGLIENLDPVIDSQLALAESTAAALRSLAGLATQLSLSDQDLESLLDNAPLALDETGALVKDLESSVPATLQSAESVAEVVNVYEDYLRQTIITYPALQSRLQSVLLPHANAGEAKLDLRTNLGDPPPCLEGYLPVSQRRDPADLSDVEAAPLHCQAPATSESAVRGARNTPCPNDPTRRSATPIGCGLVFDGSLPATAASVPLPTGDATPGMLELLGAASTGGGSASWTTLLTGPVAR